MDRAASLERVRGRRGPFDVVVVGGGATGAGIALDAALRGYQTALFEAYDFGKGTSSRSTKLIHGGVRYLEQGHVGLVRDALRERGWLFRNASAFVKPLRFVLPIYGMVERFYYGTGLFLYDRLAGDSAHRSQWLNARQAVAALPTVKQRGLSGGWTYYDGQFDDARLLLEVVKAAASAGATVANYARVETVLRDAAGRVRGVAVRDAISGGSFEVEARAVINATGAFVDRLRANAGNGVSVAPSQGAHVVVDRSFLPSNDALLIPKTPDGRVLFVIPWLGSTLIGTTDVAVPEPPVEPVPMAQEIDFILETAAAYMDRAPQRTDVRSAWAGIRPLVRHGGAKTSALSRDHTVLIEPDGLVTVTGGKWTTFRAMAEDCLNQAARSTGLEQRPCRTLDVRFDESADGGLEMAQTVEDVLARRRRTLFLDARAAVAEAPEVARQLAAQLGRDERWQQEQVTAFTELAAGYIPAG